MARHQCRETCDWSVSLILSADWLNGDRHDAVYDEDEVYHHLYHHQYYHYRHDAVHDEDDEDEVPAEPEWVINQVICLKYYESR